MLDRPCWVKCMRSVETKNGDSLLTWGFLGRHFKADFLGGKREGVDSACAGPSPQHPVSANIGL